MTKRPPHYTLEPVHVPNHVFLTLAWIIAGATLVFAIIQYPLLPNQIADHFGTDGTPDSFAAKSLGLFFLPVIFQFVLTVLFTILYRHPRYANIPGTLILDLLPPEPREQMYWLVQHMLVLTGVLMNALFAYLTIGIATTSLGDAQGLNPAMLYLLVGLLLFVSMAYAIATTKFAHRILREQQQPLKKNHRNKRQAT